MLTMNLISATWVNDNRLFSCSVSTVNPLCCFVTVKKILKKWLPRSGHLGVISSGFAFAFSVRANHIIDLDEDRNLLFQVMLSRWTGVGEWNLQTTKNHPERDFRNMPRGLRCHYRWRPSQSLCVSGPVPLESSLLLFVWIFVKVSQRHKIIRGVVYNEKRLIKHEKIPRLLRHPGLFLLLVLFY